MVQALLIKGLIIMAIMAMTLIIRLDSYQGLVLNPSRYPALSFVVLEGEWRRGKGGSGVTLHRRARLMLHALRSQLATDGEGVVAPPPGPGLDARPETAPASHFFSSSRLFSHAFVFLPFSLLLLLLLFALEDICKLRDWRRHVRLRAAKLLSASGFCFFTSPSSSPSVALTLSSSFRLSPDSPYVSQFSSLLLLSSSFPPPLPLPSSHSPCLLPSPSLLSSFPLLSSRLRLSSRLFLSSPTPPLIYPPPPPSQPLAWGRRVAIYLPSCVLSIPWSPLSYGSANFLFQSPPSIPFSSPLSP